jgi:hypothetical protein
LLHGTIRKHGQQAETVRLRQQWITVDPRDWKIRDHLTVNVGLGTGGRAQAFAQTMAIANVQKELLAGGKSNLVDDQGLYNTAAELTRIMGHKNPDKFFNDPGARDPRTGQLLHPPPPPPPGPDSIKAKAQLQIAASKAETDRATAMQRMQLEQARAQADALRQHTRLSADIELTKVKAELEARLAVLDAHVKALAAAQSAGHAREQHHAAETALGMVAAAHRHDLKMAPPELDRQGDRDE